MSRAANREGAASVGAIDVDGSGGGSPSRSRPGGSVPRWPGASGGLVGRGLGAALGVEELADRADDVALLLLGQLGVHRQGQRLAGGRFGDGEVAGLVAQGREAGLQVERDRIVDLGPDLAGGQVVAQGVADRGRHADDVLVVDVVMARPLDGERDDLIEAVRRGRGRRSARRPRDGRPSRRRGAGASRGGPPPGGRRAGS